METAVADRTPREVARIVGTAVSPRPIAWIATVDGDGTDNLTPYSSCDYVSSREPVVPFDSPNGADGGCKDTPRNALDTGESAVSVVTEPPLERTDHLGGPYCAVSDVTEFERQF